ncbi:MAG: NTP transferase domain-containing protein [Alistipes sp.]|nr:NTP transferase domain-containing protein [Alistipes sp.]
MNNNTFCVIMAGGIGSRFWPMSRKHMPKQFLDILGTGKSFIRATFERFLPLVPVENFYVVTNTMYKDLVLEHIPELDPKQVLCEPIRRNTAPCIAYAAYTLQKEHPNANMIVTPSDHLILNEVDFHAIIKECLDYAERNDALMTVGIRPSRAETGYGYIQKSNNDLISRVKCFTEKPHLELAQTFVECGEFFWNSGIFIWTVENIIKAFEKHLPDHHALFEAAKNDIGTEREQKALEQVFSESKSISVDYGIMEKADNVYVRCGDFGWSDVGTWSSVYQLSRKDRYANTKSHEGCYTYNTRSSIISVPKDKIAVVNGLRDYIVVDTDDVLMICPRSEEHSIKMYIDDVKFDGGEKHI